MNLSQSRTMVCGCFFVKNESILSQCVSFLLALQSPCKVVSKLTQFMTTDTTLPAYMAYPKFLFDMTDLSETARLVYILLLDRARVSQAKGGWADEHGNVFIFYPIQDLAKAIRNLSARQTENCPSDGKKTVCHMERKLSGNKNKENKLNESKRRSKAYGKFQNVFLSDGDMDSLRQTVPQLREYIERLSAYMQSTGKSYADHAATIRCWYDRDNPAQPSRNYDCEDDESL